MLPPGPRMPGLAQTAWFLRDPIGLFEHCRRRYGPIFTLRPSGFPPEVYVTTGELAEQIYRLDQGGGQAGEARREFLEPLVGPHSVLVLDDEPWTRHRRLLTPPLRAKQVAEYRDDIAAIAAERIATWPLGTPFALRDRLQEITLEVIIRLVFGIRDTTRLERLRALLPVLLDISGRPSVALTPPATRAWLERVPFSPSARFLRVRTAVDELLYDEIARRRTEPGGTDVLGRLLRTELSDQEIRDELITMLLAGHETTATGVAWAFERLLRNDAILTRLRSSLGVLDRPPHTTDNANRHPSSTDGTGDITAGPHDNVGIAHGTRRNDSPLNSATDLNGPLGNPAIPSGPPGSVTALNRPLNTHGTHSTIAPSRRDGDDNLNQSPNDERPLNDENYLDAVIKEALRARPVVFEAPRLLDAPLNLGGYDLPAGTLVSPFIPLVHHDPATFPHPGEFRPERFMDGKHSKSWMPFGGGRRFCVGAQLALLEMHVIIREMLTRLELSAPDPAPEGRRLKSATFAPAKLTRVIALARTPARTP